MRKRAVKEHFEPGNAASLFEAGSEALEAILACVEAAERQIWVEVYWLSADVVGRRFLAALARAALRGVDVRLIFDAFGSYDLAQAEVSSLIAAGARVAAFNPLAGLARRFHLQRLTLRDHRKLIIVDGHTAVTGGTNLTQHWLPQSEGGQGWRDELVLVRGPAVWRVCVAFEESWRYVTGETLDIIQPAPVAGDVAVSVLTQGLFPRRRQAYHAYLRQVWASKQRIYLAHAYFVPEPRLVGGLLKAVERGVDVRLLCPAQSDVSVVDFASRHVWEVLLRGGVRIFEWHSSVLHSKLAVVDQDWLTIGSLNLDARSLRNNRELNFGFRDEGCATWGVARFLQGCEAGREVTPDEFAERPYWRRCLHALSYRARALL